MGCKHSSLVAGDIKPPRMKREPRPIINPPQNISNLNFTCIDKTNSTSYIEPGSLYFQIFHISNCLKSHIYVCDATAAVYIDQCKDCIILIGACEGDVLIRNCSNCMFIITTSILRTRDVENCKFLLFCESSPIIEKTTNILIGCNTIGYEEYNNHIELCRLHLWNNKWSEIRDYTPGIQHWDFLQRDSEYIDSIIPEDDKKLIKYVNNNIIPVTYGLTYPSDNSNNEFLLYISKDYENIAFQVVNRINAYEYSNNNSNNNNNKSTSIINSSPKRSRLSSANKNSSLVYVLRTFSMLFNTQMSKYMFNKKKHFMKIVIIIHCYGDNSLYQVGNLMKEYKSECYYIPKSYKEGMEDVKTVFTIWSEN